MDQPILVQCEVEPSKAQSEFAALSVLNELELAVVGGGIGDTVL